MNCPRCGNILADGTPQCPGCGTLLTGGPPPGMPYPQGNPYPQGMPPMPPQGMPYGAYGAPPVMPRTSGMAIAGFVLAFFCSLLGLIFSIIGYSQCKNSNGTVTGEGLALAGIIISIISMFLGIIIMASGSGHHY